MLVQQYQHAECLIGRIRAVAPKEPSLPQTLSVPEAGKRYLGLGRNGSYNAAARGELPVIKVGGRYRVPVRRMEELLNSAPFRLTKTGT
jgi:excisionase family DNA binding protein